MIVPTWLITAIANIKCPKCGAKMKDKNVISVGIKKVEEDESKSYLFFTHRCDVCMHEVFIEADEMDLDDFAYMILEDLEEQTKSQDSKITEEEVKNVVKMLKESESYEDFLKSMGICNSEIEDEQC